MVEAALLRYLAVAHFGRGRGDWAQGEAPPHWRDVVAAALAPQRAALATLWSMRAPGAADDCGELRAGLEATVRTTAGAALARLYPDTLPEGWSAAPPPA